MQTVMLNLKLLVGLVLLLLSFFILDVNAQTAPLCPDNKITILNKETGGHQCAECRICSAGEGLSVKCGDVITPQTPISCEPCVLGKTYSSANEAGACKDCESCEEYRETVTPCTLTSKAVCGKCKAGAYLEFLLGMCKPCSPCCNDGKDIVAPACQVPGVPANMQCSFLRSDTCRKEVADVTAKTSISIASTLQITPSTITPSTSTSISTLYVAAINGPTSQVNQEHILEQVASDSTRPQITGGIVGGIGGIFLLAVILFFVWRRINKRKRACVKRNNVPDVEKKVKERPEQVQREHGANETDELNPAEVQLEKPPLQETGESPERVGIQDTHPPGCIDKKDLKPSSLNPEPFYHDPCHEDHRYTKPTPKKPTMVTVTVTVKDDEGPVSGVLV